MVSRTSSYNDRKLVLRYEDRMDHLLAIRQATLAIADPAEAVRRNLYRDGEVLRIGREAYDLRNLPGIVLIGLGKASPAMLSAAAEVLGKSLQAGVAAVPLSNTLPPPPNVQYIPAGHPLPDAGSLRAGAAAASLLAGTGPDDLVVVMISGGGSAMMELPLPGIELDDLTELTSRLLKSGAPIQAVNTVRKALSRIKAGGLARMAAPSRTISLILSDVVGDQLSSIASGPTVLRSVRAKTAIRTLQELEIWTSVPGAIRLALNRDQVEPSPTPWPINLLIGSNRAAVEEAKRSAQNLGFTARILSYRMEGEARGVGTKFARRLARSNPGSCLLMGGETTVSVQGAGKGGRNQELALSAAICLEGKPKLVLQSIGTDGIDGPTDAAGAIVTGETAGTAQRLGFHPEENLRANDSYPLLDAVGALVRTGPTGTNLNDLVVGLHYP